MTRLKNVFALGVALYAAPLVLYGQTGDHAADVTAIAQADKSYLEAFDRGDAKAVAAHWVEDGEYVDQTGFVLVGREAIEQEFEKFFAQNKGNTLKVRVEALHFPEQDVAVEIGDSVIMNADGKPGDRARYKAVHVKRDGAWKMLSVEEGPALPASNYVHLSQLEWLIGDWVDEEVQEDNQQPKLVVHTQTRWDAHRNFIIRTFTATADNQVTMTGTQRIGWYEPNKQIRSWTFDSDGGVTIGVWSKNGDTWVVKTQEVQRDGKTATETETATIDSLHAHSWKLTERTLDGKPLPDMLVKVQRVGIDKR